MLVQSGAHVQEDACRALVFVIMSAAQLHAYAARAMFRALSGNVAAAQPSLLNVAVWCLGEWPLMGPLIKLWSQGGGWRPCLGSSRAAAQLTDLSLLAGEYGELLVGSDAGRLLDGEEALSTTDGEVVGVLEEVLQRSSAGDSGPHASTVRVVALTALAKSATRFPGSAERIRGLLAAYASSLDLESQTRSVEYGRLFKYGTLTPQACWQGGLAANARLPGAAARAVARGLSPRACPHVRAFAPGVGPHPGHGGVGI